MKAYLFQRVQSLSASDGSHWDKINHADEMHFSWMKSDILMDHNTKYPDEIEMKFYFSEGICLLWIKG